MNEIPRGKLLVLALPLGNLSDITLRALETLREKEYLVAEDTRELAKFLQHYQIPRKTLISYREQNHDRVVSQILGVLAEGHDVVLTSDRGTPTISDPGYRLVRDALANGYEVSTLPGASALIAALSISGLPTDRFIFLGFLPRTSGKQVKILRECVAEETTFILYESPFRVNTTLESIYSALGDIDVVVARELTKIYEEVVRGKASEIIEKFKGRKLKGEFVILGRVNDRN